MANYSNLGVCFVRLGVLIYIWAKPRLVRTWKLPSDSVLDQRPRGDTVIPDLNLIQSILQDISSSSFSYNCWRLFSPFEPSMSLIVVYHVINVHCKWSMLFGLISSMFCISDVTILCCIAVTGKHWYSETALNRPLTGVNSSAPFREMIDVENPQNTEINSFYNFCS